jgi:endonuclease YncB( thermonuclease family)
MVTPSRSTAPASVSGASTRLKLPNSAGTKVATYTDVGAKAANDLDGFIAGRLVTCRAVSLDLYGRTVATCTVGAGIDLGEWLVGHGLALDWPRYSHGRYGATQAGAERAGGRVWAGSFTAPLLYRACVRAGGRPGACSDEAGARR